MKEYWISLSYATFFIGGNIFVEDAAPIAYWLIEQKKMLQWALRYYKNKGAMIVDITRMRI